VVTDDQSADANWLATIADYDNALVTLRRMSPIPT
jgi:hypothetical protein